MSAYCAVLCTVFLIVCAVLVFPTFTTSWGGACLAVIQTRPMQGKSKGGGNPCFIYFRTKKNLAEGRDASKHTHSRISFMYRDGGPDQTGKGLCENGHLPLFGCKTHMGFLIPEISMSFSLHNSQVTILLLNSMTPKFSISVYECIDRQIHVIFYFCEFWVLRGGETVP